MLFIFGHDIFSEILISKMNIELNLRITAKNHAADAEIGFLTKLIWKSLGLTRPCGQCRS